VNRWLLVERRAICGTDETLFVTSQLSKNIPKIPEQSPASNRLIEKSPITTAGALTPNHSTLRPLFFGSSTSGDEWPPARESMAPEFVTLGDGILDRCGAYWNTRVKVASSEHAMRRKPSLAAQFESLLQPWI